MLIKTRTTKLHRVLLGHLKIGMIVSFCVNHALANEGVVNYSVMGNLEVTVRRSAVDAGAITTLNYSVDVLQNEYKIKIWRPQQNANYHEYFFSDNKLTTIHHVAGAPSQTIKDTPKETNAFPTMIDRREIPPCDGSRAQFVWFAYASTHYLKGLTNEFMPPIWSPEDPNLRKQPFDILASIDRTTQSPCLPEFAAFINDGYYRSYNPGEQRNEVIALKPPFDSGYTNAYYRVTEFTNFHPYLLPLRFTFVVYSTPIGTGSLPFERLVINGLSEKIEIYQRHDISAPSFAGVSSVVDYTLLEGIEKSSNSFPLGYVAYPITNSKWLNVSQLNLLREKNKRAIGFQAISDESKRQVDTQRRWLFLVCFLVSNLMLFLFFLKKFRR